LRQLTRDLFGRIALLNLQIVVVNELRPVLALGAQTCGEIGRRASNGVAAFTAPLTLQFRLM
jgi:hypothetical protein